MVTAPFDETPASVPVLWDDGYRYGRGRLISLDERRCVVVCGDGGAPQSEYVRITPLLKGREGLFEFEGHVEETAHPADSEGPGESRALVLSVRLCNAYDEVLLSLRQRLAEG